MAKRWVNAGQRHRRWTAFNQRLVDPGAGGVTYTSESPWLQFCEDSIST